MARRLPLVLLLVAAVLGGGTVAHAARVGLAAGGLGAGATAVTRCDAAVTAEPETTGSSVSAVTVGDLAPACAGGTLRVALTADGAVLASLPAVPVPAGGGAVRLVVPAPQPAAIQVTDVRVQVVGP